MNDTLIVVMLTLKHWSNRGLHFIRVQYKRTALFIVAMLMVTASVLAVGGSAPVQAQSLSDAAGLGSSFGGSVSTCAIETVGWVICPVMRTIAKLADYGFSFINENYLKIEYEISNTNSGVYTAWEVMRTIANVVFVLVFLVIIYSQITGRNAGGYNIKRMLPRLIIGAILVNVSYYICVVAIDISNILGTSILDVMKGITDRIGTPAMSLDNAANGFQDGILSDITSSILTKSGTVWILLAPIAAVTISIAVVSAAGIVLLIARKVIVAMLVLVSPLLFVSYLLPNIEHYFQQWLRLFTQLLLLFPVIAFLLGTGQIISATIINVGQGGDANYSVKDDSYQAKKGGSGSATTDLAACAAAVLPLLGVWFVMKGLSSVMTTAGSRLAENVSGRSARSRERAEKLAQAQAKIKQPTGINPGGPAGGGFARKPAFSRLAGRRHKASMGGSANPLGAGGSEAGRANQPPQTLASTLDNLMGGGKTAEQKSAEDAAKKIQELNNAQISADQANAANATNAQVAAVAKAEEEKKGKTAKDIFNNMNHSRQTSAGGNGGGGNGSGGGNSGGGGNPGGSGQVAPKAPNNNFNAANMAQQQMTGAQAPQAPAGGSARPTIIAVPVQVDASTLLNNQNQQMAAQMGSQHQPPTTGMQQKAKARAQKYIFDSANDVDDAAARLEILNKKETPEDKDIKKSE
jgi:hypothetical protein